MMQWLEDKVLAAFGRSEAPVVRTENLQPGETIVLAYGLIPNRKGHPLIQSWVGARFNAGTLEDTTDLESVLEATGFTSKGKLPNSNEPIDASRLQPLIPETVKAVRAELTQARSEFDKSVRPELDRQLDRLSGFRKAKLEQLELRFEKMDHMRDAKKRKVENLYENYKTWIKDTMETEDNPSIRIAAIFTSLS